LVAAGVLAALSAGGAKAETGDCAQPEASCTIGDRLIFMPAYFAQYSPVTALDMVRRVPGFVIDPGEKVRGFGGGAGNVLIDGQRPSTKSADIFDTLGRIAADGVRRVELIRGGAGGFDVASQAIVVNVVKKKGAGADDPSLWRACSAIPRRFERRSSGAEPAPIDGKLQRSGKRLS
jgi:hypothetical protein